MEENKKVMTDRELKRLIRKGAKGSRPKGSFKRTLAMAAMLVTVLPVFGSVLYSAYSSAKSEEAAQEQAATVMESATKTEETPLLKSDDLIGLPENGTEPAATAGVETQTTEGES